MSRSGQNNEKPRGQTGAAKKSEGPDRPGASGHRFGPDLACSECGILWDVHQREPKPCTSDVVADVFARRPSGDFENGAKGDPVEVATTSAIRSTESTAPTRIPSDAAEAAAKPSSKD